MHAHIQVWLIQARSDGDAPMKMTSFNVDFSSLPGRDFRFYVVENKVSLCARVCVWLLIDAHVLSLAVQACWL
jgi:hypothetical protein